MNTTIGQWEVFEAVVQLGSFAAAASKMNRSQSTISYAISRLQDQFKTPLLEMKGRRRNSLKLERRCWRMSSPCLLDLSQ